jgi:multidrug efflux pump subunit AcrA (membrane-fusion protein)
MNLVGKIFTVLILVMSIMFMAFAMMVYATHRNWQQAAKTAQSQLTQIRSENQRLNSEIEDHKATLAHERAARRQALASLETQVQEKQRDFEARNQQYSELLAQQRTATDAVLNAQQQLNQLKDQISKLEEEVRTARLDRDQQFARVKTLTDQMHQAEGIRVRLEERLKQLTTDFTAATTVLKANDLTMYTPVGNIPPRVRGEVLAVGPDEIEISIGEDDGLRPGHTVVVSRRDKYLARAEITKVSPDRAVGRIQFRNAPIQEGDRVQTKSEIR